MSGTDDASLSKLGQMVGNKVLWLANELHEFTNAAIAAAKLADQLPAQRLAEEPEDLGCLFRWHLETISNEIDIIYQALNRRGRSRCWSHEERCVVRC